MPKSLLMASGLLAVGLALLHLSYPLPYVFRVMVDQQPDFDDIHQYPASVIAAAPVPGTLPVALHADFAAVIEEHPGTDSYETLLESTNTTAFVVVHKGRLIEQRYLAGYDADSEQNTFSVSKSLTSALIGLAVHDGVVDLDAPITQYLPRLRERDARFARITVAHLLNMRSGIHYSNTIAFPIINADDPLIYYYPDLESLVLEHTTVAAAPGTFQYNNYNPPLLGLILRRTTGLAVSDYLRERLWQPLGASHAAGWTTDDHGFERMESGFHATAPDLARFGLLYLNRGLADGRPVVPEAWVLDTTATPEPIEVKQYNGRQWGYRMGWWVVPRPEGPPDYSAIGRGGQFIYVSPQYETVFVRNGTDSGDWGDRDWTGLFYFVAARL